MSTRQDPRWRGVTKGCFWVLGAFALFVLLVVAWLESWDRAREDRARWAKSQVDLERLVTIATEFRASEGRWPADMAELVNRSVSVPLDPWREQPYLHRLPEDGPPVFTSLGKDGRVGGDGVDEDISRSPKP